MRRCEREACRRRFKPRKPNQRFCRSTCRKRDWEDRNRPACSGCSVPLPPSAAGRGDRSCDWCRVLDAKFARAMRLLAIARGWQAGLGRSEIGRRSGSTPGTVTRDVSVLRAGGLDLEYRRRDNIDPDRIERLHDGRDAWWDWRQGVAA